MLGVCLWIRMTTILILAVLRWVFLEYEFTMNENNINSYAIWKKRKRLHRSGFIILESLILFFDEYSTFVKC